MPELRKNVVTGELVVIAPERARRPHDHQEPAAAEATSWSETCPFCPRNEAKTPPATLVAPAEGDWRVRVVPNKFSALASEGEAWSSASVLQPRGGAVGPHEVIIEGRDHAGRLGSIDPETRAQVVRAWHRRTNDFFARPEVKHVVLFKNQGPAAGSSLSHPHSQIVGLPAIPGRFEHRKMIAVRHQLAHGRCLLCDVAEDERGSGRRVVAETEHHLAFVPFAAFSPLHVWIVPRTHAPSFATATEAELESLDRILAFVLRAVDAVGARPDLNLVFLGGHPDDPEDAPVHAYVSLVGRTTRAAGFELGTGMYINPSSPEDQAEKLRAALAPA